MRLRVDPERLDYELATRGLAARELAALANVSEATVCRARAGRRVDIRTLRRIADALRVTPTVLGIDSLLSGTAVDGGRRNISVPTSDVSPRREP